MKRILLVLAMVSIQIAFGQAEKETTHKKKYFFNREAYGKIKSFRFIVTAPGPVAPYLGNITLPVITPFSGDYDLNTWYVQEYDKNGNRLFQHQRGKFYSYSYDHNDHLVEYLRYDTVNGVARKTVRHKEIYQGDKVIRREDIHHFNPECPFQVFDYVYDPAGNKISETIHTSLCNQSAEHLSVTRLLSTFNNHQLITDSVYNDDKLTSSKKYTYDAKGRHILSVEMSLSRGVMVQATDSLFYDDRNNLIRTARHTIYGITGKRYTYDNNNRVLEKISKELSAEEKEKYVYNTAGQVISESRSREQASARIDYQLDKQGNVIGATLFNDKNVPIRYLTVIVTYY